MNWRTRLVAVTAAMLAAACYEPRIIDCVVPCEGPDECADGQVCGSDGYCAAPAVAGSCGQLPAVDGNSGAVCAAPCGEGVCLEGVCVFACGDGECSDRVHCPDGVPCRVECLGDGACAGGVDCHDATSCEVICDGEDSCANEVRCHQAPCQVTCSGPRACDNTVKCNDSCACDVDCDGFEACSGGSDCPDGCDDGDGGCRDDASCQRC